MSISSVTSWGSAVDCSLAMGHHRTLWFSHLLLRPLLVSAATAISGASCIHRAPCQMRTCSLAFPVAYHTLLSYSSCLCSQSPSSLRFYSDVLFLWGLLEILHIRKTSNALAQPGKLCPIPAYLLLLHVSVSDIIHIIPLLLQYSLPCPLLYKLCKGRTFILLRSGSPRLQRSLAYGSTP